MPRQERVKLRLFADRAVHLMRRKCEKVAREVGSSAVKQLRIPVRARDDNPLSPRARLFNFLRKARKNTALAYIGNGDKINIRRARRQCEPSLSYR